LSCKTTTRPFVAAPRGVTLVAGPSPETSYCLQDCQSFTSARLFDFSFEEAATFRFVDNFDVRVADGDRCVRSVGRCAVIVTRQIDIGRSSNDLNRRMPILVRQSLSESVHSARLRFRPSRVFAISSESTVFSGAMPVSVRRRNDVLGCLQRSDGCRHVSACPVELSVVDVSLSIAKILKEFTKVVVVRRFEEIQSSDISQICGQFFRLVFAQHFDWSRTLCVTDFLIPKTFDKTTFAKSAQLYYCVKQKILFAFPTVLSLF